MSKLIIVTAALALCLSATAGPACCPSKGGSPAKAKEDAKDTACARCPADKCEGKCAAKAETTVTTEQLKALVDKGGPLVLLDARTGKFDDGRRIPGAKVLAADADAETVAKLAGADKAAAIVTYCGGVKCPASSKLAGHLRKLGYTNVSEYPAGIAGWADAGHPVEGGK